MDKKTNAINYDRKILSRNLRYLTNKYKLDFEKVNITQSTFNNYTNGDHTPPIATVIRIMTLLKNPHDNITLDQLVFKDLIPKDEKDNLCKKKIGIDGFKKRWVFETIRSLSTSILPIATISIYEIMFFQTVVKLYIPISTEEVYIDLFDKCF